MHAPPTATKPRVQTRSLPDARHPWTFGPSRCTLTLPTANSNFSATETTRPSPFLLSPTHPTTQSLPNRQPKSAPKPRDYLKVLLGSERRGCPQRHGADAEPQQEVAGRPGADALPHAAAGAAAPRDEVGGRGVPKRRAPQRRGRRCRQRWRLGWRRQGSRGERPGRAPVQVIYSRLCRNGFIW
jgi:hypothetical protein